MIKVCDICYGEMIRIHDAYNFRYYWYCIDCGNQVRCEE